MELLVRTKNFLGRQEISRINSLGFIVTYSSTFIPLLIVKADNPFLLSNLPFIQSISTGRSGNYLSRGDFLQTIVITPQIRRGLLVRECHVGWGAKVAILDSGYSGEISVVAEKDFTGTGTVDRKGHGTRIARIIKHLAPAAQLLIGTFVFG